MKFSRNIKKSSNLFNIFQNWHRRIVIVHLCFRGRSTIYRFYLNWKRKFRMAVNITLSKLRIASLLNRGFSTSAVQASIKNVTVIGGGLMGAGIAQVAGINFCVQYRFKISRSKLFCRLQHKAVTM